MARYRYMPRDDLYTLNTRIADAQPGYFKWDGKMVPCIRVNGRIVFCYRDEHGRPYHPMGAYAARNPKSWAFVAWRRAQLWIEAAEATLQEDNISTDAAWWIDA